MLSIYQLFQRLMDRMKLQRAQVLERLVSYEVFPEKERREFGSTRQLETPQASHANDEWISNGVFLWKEVAPILPPAEHCNVNAKCKNTMPTTTPQSLTTITNNPAGKEDEVCRRTFCRFFLPLLDNRNFWGAAS
jgi:hypothetical protein